MHNQSAKLAILGALFGGVVWGAFWVPVRALEAAGLAGLWPVVAVYAIAVAVVAPLALWRWRSIMGGGWRLHAAAVPLGAAMAIYAAAFLYTEVVPAVLLYYLSPVWGFLLARLFLADPITPARWIALALALAGAAVALGPESWPPLPRNIGDWMALASGFLWVVGSMVMLGGARASSLDHGIAFLIWGAVGITAAAWAVGPGPDLGIAASALLWLVPVVALVVVPGSLAAIHGASRLNPGLAGILFMGEIGVSLGLAAMLTDEEIGWAQGVGVAMIALAGASEGGLAWIARRRARRTASSDCAS